MSTRSKFILNNNNNNSNSKSTPLKNKVVEFNPLQVSKDVKSKSKSVVASETSSGTSRVGNRLADHQVIKIYLIFD
jgi:hypothetical protein